MELRPILSAMLRNKTGAALVGLQIALTLAIVANSMFIIMQRVEKIGRPPGIDSANLFFVQSNGFGPGYDHLSTIRADLDLIRSLPGVIAASSINAVPLSGSGSSTTIGTKVDDTNIRANYYMLDEYGMDALGVALAEGRNFLAQEVQYNPDASGSNWVPWVIVSRDLGRALFGDEPALGKSIYIGPDRTAVIVGVIDNMLGSWVDWDKLTQVMLIPRIPSGSFVRYVVRVEPGRLNELMAEAERKLSDSNLHRAISWIRPHGFYKERSYRSDSRMVTLLLVMVILMIAITALGIVGLASFHVNVRRKQIGTRRAIGARRIDILRYFMLENWLLTTGGVLVGTVLAFAFGHWLSSAYSLPRLQPVYVIAGAVVLWLLGQAAVIVPARRAAAIPPAVATRTV